MGRRQRFRVAYLLGSLLLLGASLHAPTAYSAPGDPPSGSPAGAVYQLPLEQGRADGAPKGGGGTPAGGDGGSSGTSAPKAGTSAGSDTAATQGESGSLYRSENNFGSSSHVPGTPAASGSGKSGKGGPAGSAGGATGSAGGASANIAGGAAGSPAAGNGNTSASANFVLLGAIALLAAGAAVLSRRFASGRAGT